MDILFKAKTLVTQKWVESDSILQGTRAGKNYVFLKYKESPEQFSKWTECEYKTLKQLK